MLSLQARYAKERMNRETIETDKGFLTYAKCDEEYRIFDLYVLPEFRKEGHASYMANQVASLAKENGCKILTGSVDVRANGSTDSTKVLLAYGFSIIRTDGPMIYFRKDIE